MGGRKDKTECMQFSMSQLYYWFKLQMAWSRSSVGRVLSLNDWPQLQCCVTALPVSLSLCLLPHLQKAEKLTSHPPWTLSILYMLALIHPQESSQ